MECDKHGPMETKIDKVLMHTEMIIAALYGRLGDVDGDGIGLIARVHQHDARIKDLEQLREETGATIKEVVIQWGPSILALAVAIGIVLHEKGVL